MPNGTQRKRLGFFALFLSLFSFFRSDTEKPREGRERESKVSIFFFSLVMGEIFREESEKSTYTCVVYVLEEFDLENWVFYFYFLFL